MQTKRPDTTHATRQEKLQTIAALFGSSVADQLSGGPGPDGPQGPVEVDPDRLAWQRNRLIQHVRRQGSAAARPKPVETTAPLPELQPARQPAAPSALACMRTAAAQSDLSGEHPTVIAHLIRAEPQHIRVAILRQLPGHTARTVMSRLLSD
ncbi:MAG: hypothetical protein AAF376_10355 [Pseudomonadota bacterium]